MAVRMICMNVTYVCPFIQKANKHIKEKKKKIIVSQYQYEATYGSLLTPVVSSLQTPVVSSLLTPVVSSLLTPVGR